MRIIITRWALDAYLELKYSNVFSHSFYQEQLRPDALLLNNYPGNPKFENGKFWSKASLFNQIISNGFKMKWHQVGNGKVQLRLPVAMVQEAYLCEGYVKHNDKQEKRFLAKFKTHCQLIKEGHFITCGELT